MRRPPTTPTRIRWNDWPHRQNIGRKAWTRDVHHDNKLSLGTEAPSGNDRGSPAWLHKLQLNIKTLEHMHRTNCMRISGTANQQILFREIFRCSQCIMHIIIHSSFNTPYITLIKGEPSHSLRGSKYTPFITFFYPSQLLCLRGSVGLITSNYIVVTVTSELTD